MDCPSNDPIHEMGTKILMTNDKSKRFLEQREKGEGLFISTLTSLRGGVSEECIKFVPYNL